MSFISCHFVPLVRLSLVVDNEWFQRASDHRQRRFWRGVRMQKGWHRKNVVCALQKQKIHCVLCWDKSSRCVFLRYAMKCLDKKRIKMKQGETLALNERIMLSLVSTGVSDAYTSGVTILDLHINTAVFLILLSLFLQDCPFIVCMTYAFHTPDKLCFILDLMNGED